MSATASPELVVVGAGGHGRELVATVLALNELAPTWQLLGVVDDAPERPELLERLGVPLLGGLEQLAELQALVALGLGSIEARRRVATRVAELGHGFATVRHPGAWVGPDVHLGEGVVLADRCTITTDVVIGAHTHLNVAAAVQHDSVVGDFVQISPGVLVNGDCSIGDGVFLGTAAVVTRGCSVGAGATVGAGAVVLDDVEPGATVVGVPARPLTRRGQPPALRDDPYRAASGSSIDR